MTAEGEKLKNTSGCLRVQAIASDAVAQLINHLKASPRITYAPNSEAHTFPNLRKHVSRRSFKRSRGSVSGPSH